MLVALAAAIALHEILAGLLPNVLSQPKPEPERIEHVTVARIVRTPKPTPSATPMPTPKPPRAIAVTRHATVVSPTATAVQAPAGKAARAEPIKRVAAARPKPPHVTHARPTVSVPVGGQGAGAGNASGAGSVGNGESGNGTGDQGNGAGGGAPCGAVDFSATGLAKFNPQTGFYERDNITATVHFADGHAEQVPLDWTWRFKTENMDPFSNPDVPMFFQFPPKTQRPSEPPAVQYIMQYSGSGGETKLKDDCPNIPPPATPHPAT